MFRFAVVLITAMLIAGCKGSGGSGGSSGGTSSGSSFFTPGSSSSSSVVLTTTEGSGSNSIPTYHHPEPNTMILLSVGLVGLAAAALRKKKKI